MLRRRSFLAASAALVGCRPPHRAIEPVADVWTSKLGADHPLTGRRWDVARAAFVSEAEVVRRLDGSPHVLLGEQHDNLDHHRLQARMVAAIAAGRSIVLEMIDRDRQAELDGTAKDLEAMPRILEWAKRGWPPFDTYRAIFEAANAAQAKLVAGNLPRADAKAIAKGGAVSPASAAWVARPSALADPLHASLEDELRASHCGHLPDAMVAGMASAQLARDVCLADAMIAASKSVLIAGAGHARTDRGVPFQLAGRGARSVSLAFVEVATEHVHPDDYAARWAAATLPFDLVWFTPRASDADPCAKFGGPAATPT